MSKQDSFFERNPMQKMMSGGQMTQLVLPDFDNSLPDAIMLLHLVNMMLFFTYFSAALLPISMAAIAIAASLSTLV